MALKINLDKFAVFFLFGHPDLSLTLIVTIKKSTDCLKKIMPQGWPEYLTVTLKLVLTSLSSYICLSCKITQMIKIQKKKILKSPACVLHGLFCVPIVN